MPNPLTDLMPLLAFWGANWQSLLLGLIVFMGTLALLFSGLVWRVLCVMEYRKQGLIEENKRLAAADQALTASLYRKAHYAL
jgi:hypothetical protein